MGWGEFTSVIRHELIHVHTVQNHGAADHGVLFESLAETLNTSETCSVFSRHLAKYKLLCSACQDEVGYRYQSCKTVREPEKYVSGCCEAPLRVIELPEE